MKIFTTVCLKCILKSRTKLHTSDCLPGSLIYQVFIGTYYVPGTTLGPGATAVHKTVKNTCLQGAYILKMIKAASKWASIIQSRTDGGKNMREWQRREGAQTARSRKAALRRWYSSKDGNEARKWKMNNLKESILGKMRANAKAPRQNVPGEWIYKVAVWGTVGG